MKRVLCLAAIGAMFASAASAASIAPNTTLSGVVVSGKASVYDVFGHAGKPGGDYGPDLPAVLTTFGAGSGNIFFLPCNRFGELLQRSAQYSAGRLRWRHECRGREWPFEPLR